MIAISRQQVQSDTPMPDEPKPPRATIIRFEERFRARVIALWERSGLTRPWNDPEKDIDRKLTDPVGAFFLLVAGDDLIGTVMAGYDGHRGSIYYLAIDPDHQQAGYGRQLMAHCEAHMLALGCPKINLFVRHGNDAAMQFYDALGYQADATAVLGKRLIPDT